MSEDTAWPLKSPRAALLSSPSGRKKYSETTLNPSPMKRSATTPGLLERLRAARANKDILDEPAVEDEEDEETLQLQLAAIEAKLKLKKLQQNKEKQNSDGLTSALSSSRPSSAAAPADTYSERYGSIDRGTYGKENIQVTLSPTKRPVQASEPRSPSRVLLGIDKGMKASDISLKRARMTINDATRGKVAGSDRSHSRSHCSTAPGPSGKSFSERMATVRDGDRSADLKRNSANGGRSAGFKLNAAVIDRCRAAAEQSSQRSKSPAKAFERPGYSREDVLSAQAIGTKGLKKSSTLPNLRQSPSRPSSRDRDPGSVRGDAALYEGFSGLDLASRILPHSFLKRTLPEDEYRIYTVPDLLRDVTSPNYELSDEVGNYVVFGIIAAKSNPRDHRQKAEEQSLGNADWERKWEDGSNNSRKFIVMTLTNLEWSLDLFLFGTAVPRYHRLTPGTVVAILNPTLMPPKKGREDTGAFSLTLHNGEDTILEIGQARNLGFCKAVRKDGKDCGQWVNAAKTEICEFHLSLQLHKTQSKRMGINAGFTAFGGIGEGSSNQNKLFDGRGKAVREGQGRNGLMKGVEGKKFNQYTGAYYVSAPTPSAVRAPGSAAPFMADAQESRDKKSLLKKRQEARAREDKIAQQLGLWEGGKAGSEYLRHRTGAATDVTGKGNEDSQKSALSTRSQVMRSKSDAGRNGNGKRAADSVRLSPMKKTRFVTDKGIREAGRESLGVKDSGEEDDLDIV